MIKVDDYVIFKSNESTLKNTSKDDHVKPPCYMTNSLISVVNFDKVKEKYIRDLHLSQSPKSNDALFIGNEKCVFIEFKNGYIDLKEAAKLREKIVDSMIIFTDIISQGISNTRTYLDYILVYNQLKNTNEPTQISPNDVQESQSRDILANKILGFGKETLIKYNLERYKGFYFKNVYTSTQEEFNNGFPSKYN